MPDRTKILIGAGIAWAISVCCLLFRRKIPTVTAILSFVPSLSQCSQRMDNEEEQNISTGDAGPSAELESSISNNIRAKDTKKQWAPNFLAGSPPLKFVSLEEIVHAMNGMKNMALAHEIAVDKNFELQKLIEAKGDSLHARVKEIMHKAFWNILADQLAEDPPNYTQALVLLMEIKECLNELVMPHHTKIRENVNEVLDVDLIKQQAEQGVLDFHHYSRYVLSIMGKLCAPVRDEKIKQLEQCTDVIETFKGIMEIIQLMRLDLVNFTFTMMRPNIVASSVEYEKMKFAEFLKIQADGLQYTRHWLLKNLDCEKVAAASADAKGLKQVTYNLLTESYLDLLEWDCNPDAETLMLDEGRLLDIRDKTNILNIIGSILLLVNNTVGAPVQGVSSFQKNIKDHLAVLLESVHSNKDLETVMPNIVLQVKEDVRTTLKEVGASDMSSEMENSLDGQIQDLVNEDHKIRLLIGSRIRQFLQQVIVARSTTAQQIPSGLSALQEELTIVATRFSNLVLHNRNVFGEYYEKIVADALTNPNIHSTIDDNEIDA